MIKLDHVSKRYDGRTIVDDLSLSVPDGAFCVLLGPSGCGKSTALRIIAGLAEPTQGVVDWKATARTENANRLGFVFQEPTLMPWANVANNVLLPLKLKGVASEQASERVAAALDTTQRRISGTLTILYTNNSPDTLDFVWLQLDQNLYRTDSRGYAMGGGRRINPKQHTDGYVISMGVEMDTLGVQSHGDALFFEEGFDGCGDVFVFARDEAGGFFDDGDFTAEAAEDLGEFEANVAAAYDDEMTG